VPRQNTLVRLAYQNLTGPNLALYQMYDSMCNRTFIVFPGALVNGSTNAKYYDNRGRHAEWEQDRNSTRYYSDEVRR
jgi:hypothetical protein